MDWSIPIVFALTLAAVAGLGAWLFLRSRARGRVEAAYTTEDRYSIPGDLPATTDGEGATGTLAPTVIMLSVRPSDAGNQATKILPRGSEFPFETLPSHVPKTEAVNDPVGNNEPIPDFQQSPRAPQCNTPQGRAVVPMAEAVAKKYPPEFSAASSRPGEYSTQILTPRYERRANTPSPASFDGSIYAWLQPLEGSGHRFPVLAPSTMIGRSEHNDLVLEHDSVSRQHAILTIDAGGIAQLSDRGTVNGIRVNGEPVGNSPVNNGDVVQFGQLRFRFLEGPRLIRQRTQAKDAVDCSVFAPAKATAGEAILIQVSLHVIDQLETATAVATLLDPDASRRGTSSLALDLERGARVDIAIDGDGLEIAEPIAALRWNGTGASCAFRATVPSTTTRKQLVPKVHLATRGTPLAHVSFKIGVGRGDDAARRPAEQHAVHYRRVFVSYSSNDRREVLKRLQTLETLRISFFADVLDLAPGDRWERVIKREIETCDLFLLFWSHAARASPWVTREIEHARAVQLRSLANLPAILPVPLEKAPPPVGLEDMHFNSPICQLIANSASLIS